MYKVSEGVVSFEEYRKVHSKLAEILRPGMDREELEEVVKADYEYDCGEGKKGELIRERLKEQLFEMVDVWTAGVDRLEYLAFLRLLKVKIGRMMKMK
jgi:hypothetical protein